MSDKAPVWLIDATALLALAALTLLFFCKIALTNRALAGLDVFTYFYPYRDLVSEALRAGRLPLWNPYLFMGAPLLANSQAAVLYPLHWPLLWLSTPKQIAWSIVLHIWLAGAGAYLFGRRAARLRPLAALIAAIIFALGGFLGAQVEHVNQLNASAWLPWLLLCVAGIGYRVSGLGYRVLGGGAVVGLMLLAGHTQAAYIVLFGAGVYALSSGPSLRLALRRLAALAAMIVEGILLAAAQLLPTLELSRLSVRGSGLPYNEAASFSLKPALVFKAFLPPLLWAPPFSEYVAYVGLLGLALAAVGARAVLKKKQPGGEMLALALLGVFLAFGPYNPVYYLLYKLMPGMALFRAPARWLLLYSFGAAMLAGIGMEVIARQKAFSPGTGKKQPLTLPIAALLVAELFLAGRRLAYNRPTAPAAFDSLRSAPAHLLADQAHESGNEPFRFLSISDIGYDPGDMGDLQALYRDQLPEEAIYDLIVAAKMKEVLAYNLPMRYRLFSVDGYDGGLLPIRNYVTLERIFLAEDEIWPDGRLRQQLRQTPPARLLSLLNVKYVITDKTQDVWSQGHSDGIDGVFYDLEHTLPLGQVTLTDLPDSQATRLGIVSYLTGSTDLTDGAPVARVTITDTHGAVITRTLRAGEHTAEGVYESGAVAHHQAQVGHRWRDNKAGNDYLAVLDLESAFRPTEISVRSLLPGEPFRLRGMTLIDDSTRTSRILAIDPAYRQVHSGDVKIYENLAVLPRAFVVHQSRVIAEDEKALAVLKDPAFDPRREVILAEGEGLMNAGAGPDVVEIVSYEAERVQIRANLASPGYLLLTDANYPGWVAQVDGQLAPIRRANLYFRALKLEPGEHQITFQFRPASVRLGLVTSLISWLLWALALAIAIVHSGRKSSSSV